MYLRATEVKFLLKIREIFLRKRQSKFLYRPKEQLGITYVRTEELCEAAAYSWKLIHFINFSVRHNHCYLHERSHQSI